jgi:hypothetical protein
MISLQQLRRFLLNISLSAMLVTFISLGFGTASSWADISSTRGTANLTNFNCTDTSGWAGNGTTANPYRLVFDGTNDTVNTGKTTVDLGINGAAAKAAESQTSTEAAA